MSTSHLRTFPNLEIYKISKQLKSKSPILIETAVLQNNIQRQMQRLMDQVMELSTKTFYITPAINRAFGQASSNIYNTISSFEQKKIKSVRRGVINIDTATQPIRSRSRMRLVGLNVIAVTRAGVERTGIKKAAAARGPTAAKTSLRLIVRFYT